MKNGNLLKKQFKEDMQNRILSGELKPGQRLLPERELALQYGISRGSVNQGILDLERMGFIRLVPRKGAFVAEYVKKATPETLSALMAYNSTKIDPKLFFDLMEMRILIESHSAKLACKNKDEEAVLKLKKIADELNAEDTEIAKKMYDFHHQLIEISDNASFMMIFNSFETMLKNMMGVHAKNKESMLKSIPHYHSLALAIAEKDEGKAQSSLLKIMDIASNYLKSVLQK